MQRRSFLVLPLTAWLALSACDQPRKAQVFNALDINAASFGRDFRLHDADGRVRTLADFRGKLVMLFFGFIQCPDVCPTTLARAAKVRKQLGQSGPDLQLLFVTLDPERDGPELLRAYTAGFDADILGLYDDVAGTARLAEEFRIYFRKVPNPDGYTLDHSTLSYVFDRQGRLRLAVDHNLSVEQIAADLRQLLEEK